MKVRLGDICEVFTDGDWIESKDQSVSGIRLIQTGNIGNGEFLNKTAKKRYISKMTFNNLKCTEVFAGDILISRLPDPIGRCCIVPELPERAITAVDCTICRVKESIADLNYLCCFLQSPKYFSQLKVKITGTTRKRISRKNLGEIQVSLPSLEEQKKIASNIYQITHLMNIRKKEYALLDQLVKSRFMEMFGDNSYLQKTLNSICLSKGEYGASSAAVAYDSTRPRYIRITDINDDGSLNNNAVCSKYVEDDQTYRLHYGDFLFARMGATVGKTYVYKSGQQIFAGYLIRYKLDLEQIDPVYLFYFTQQDRYKKWVKLNQSGAAQPGINARQYGNLTIPLPPLPLQQQFAAFVEKVDKSKLAVKQSLEKLETLKKSLMQQYFG